MKRKQMQLADSLHSPSPARRRYLPHVLNRHGFPRLRLAVEGMDKAVDGAGCLALCP